MPGLLEVFIARLFNPTPSMYALGECTEQNQNGGGGTSGATIKCNKTIWELNGIQEAIWKHFWGFIVGSRGASQLGGTF